VTQTEPATNTPVFQPEKIDSFHYSGYEFDLASGLLRCHYTLGDLSFEEQITFSNASTSDVDPELLDRALWLVYLLAGISYYKAAAPLTIVVDCGGLTPAERRLLEAFYLNGLGEYSYQNNLDLSGLTIVAAHRDPSPERPRVVNRRALIPFGGGLDSIVTVEGMRDKVEDAALFVVSKQGDRFDAIEEAAKITGLGVVRAERRLDDQILRSRQLGFRNGHVPVTGILSAIAVTSAILDGRDAVVMSNEWSASSGNVEVDGRTINHQWSKTLAFEDLLRDALDEAFPGQVDYFSWLRPFSEVWIAKRFAELIDYHPVFRSCNRAFHIDRAHRLDHWCGECDKCDFIDLILSPYLGADELAGVFDGNEPLGNPDRVGQFRTLLGLTDDIKPFECVGDVDECRAAILLAARRSDRASNTIISPLADQVRALLTQQGEDIGRYLNGLLQPLSDHRIPDHYAPDDLLV